MLDGVDGLRDWQCKVTHPLQPHHPMALPRESQLCQLQSRQIDMAWRGQQRKRKHWGREVMNVLRSGVRLDLPAPQ
jgi:hypothetical protein